ncbi:MAG: hypothetical protein ACRYFS_10970 [Janthinobacterium lividum]
MNKISRHTFLVGTAGLITALSMNARSHADPSEENGVGLHMTAGQTILTNGHVELTVDTSRGLNPHRLRDISANHLYADADYIWPGGTFPALSGKPHVERNGKNYAAVTFFASLGDLAIEQTFIADAKVPNAILERLTVRNLGTQAVSRPEFRCGFAKTLKSAGAWMPDAEATHFCAVPYRRETDGVVRDFPLRTVAETSGSYGGWSEPTQQTPTWGSEGWVLTAGESSLLLAKHNPDAMEWSLLTPMPPDPAQTADTTLCFGGAGFWKHGSPEGFVPFAPGRSFQFGETLLRIVPGDWKQAYYAYRAYTDSKGCGLRQDYNPPVHWNELYENGFFNAFAPHAYEAGFMKNVAPRLQKELYTLDDMKAQAAKAHEIGCEALYLDPGWSTGSNTHVWDADRLGSEASFVAMMRRDYRLKVSVWIDLAGFPPTYSDAEVVPLEGRQMEQNGTRSSELLCVPSPVFQASKTQRLMTLAQNGITFMMIDSDQYTGPCYDPSHGHSVPSTREEHARGVWHILHAVREKYPHLYIELHDPVTGPSSIHYTPTYYLYARPHSHTELWGHEFMWDSMGDLMSGHALSLYYYNLAYSIPLYLHIGLKTDNVNALVFWWYASTCRHLGVGGQHPDPAVWQAHKSAMKTYLKFKRFYTQGTFYGLEETAHAHTLPAEKTSVINLFNLTDQPVERSVSFHLSEVGLKSGLVSVEGASVQQSGGAVTLHAAIPARGHVQATLRQA